MLRSLVGSEMCIRDRFHNRECDFGIYHGCFIAARDLGTLTVLAVSVAIRTLPRPYTSIGKPPYRIDATEEITLKQWQVIAAFLVPGKAKPITKLAAET